jgi:hypothetical protein
MRMDDGALMEAAPAEVPQAETAQRESLEAAVRAEKRCQGRTNRPCDNDLPVMLVASRPLLILLRDVLNGVR